MTRREPDLIPADDGHSLRATWYRPDQAPRGAVLVAPAMATRPSFYDAFAASLADQGFLVLTFGYRGTEPHADPRRTQADILTWASDAAAALEALHAELDRTGSDAPITWLGHSLGGQILGFVDHSLVQQVILVATRSRSGSPATTPGAGSGSSTTSPPASCCRGADGAFTPNTGPPTCPTSGTGTRRSRHRWPPSTSPTTRSSSDTASKPFSPIASRSAAAEAWQPGS